MSSSAGSWPGSRPARSRAEEEATAWPRSSWSHVTKRFPDGTTAVDDVTFTIADGEFFILVGPSGCGKSTLLNMIVGLEDITEGEIKVDGKVVNDVDPKDRNMAMVFQSYALYPHMTVRENSTGPARTRSGPPPSASPAARSR